MFCVSYFLCSFSFIILEMSQFPLLRHVLIHTQEKTNRWDHTYIETYIHTHVYTFSLSLSFSLFFSLSLSYTNVDNKRKLSSYRDLGTDILVLTLIQFRSKIDMSYFPFVLANLTCNRKPANNICVCVIMLLIKCW